MATTPVVPTTQQQVAATVTTVPVTAPVNVTAPVVAPEPVIDTRPRNADGTFATQETLKSETPEYKVFDIGGGKFRYEYATGEKFSGTLEEIASSNAAAHVKTKQWAQTQRQAPQVPAVKTPEQVAEEQAQSYILDMVAKAVGATSGEALKNQLNGLTESSQQFSGRMLAAEFQASTPDFNPTPENSDKLCKILDDAKLPYNVTTMQMAHAHAIKNNIYQAAPAQQQQATTMIPPMIQSNASAVNAGNPQEPNINMKAEDLKRMLDVARAQQQAR